jgi:IS5 family transposase
LWVFIFNSPIGHFKEQLKDKNLSQTLFDLFTDSLQVKGMIAKTGSMVDASFVDVPRQRNSKDDDDTIKAGSVPIVVAKTNTLISKRHRCSLG